MQEKTKFYIAVDCEGLACTVGEGAGSLGTGKNYEFACKQATREACATARALFDCGATDVIVWDAHGTGVNLDYDAFDPRCTFVHGSGHKGRFVGLDESFAAVLFIGYHAKSGQMNAVLSHTYSFVAVEYYKINGEEVGELAVDAAYAGEKGVPVLFCASDDVCIAEAKSLFGEILTVQTKTSLSRTSALSKHPLAVCDEIYDTLVQALREGNIYCTIKPYCFAKPVVVELRYKNIEHPATLVLFDRDGAPFARPDAYTRIGVLDKISDLL